ncbi:hypothetical protein GCM10010307_11530 [Streptomyces vastus]|uniref:Uncharacterized protein n=1 Tax=Streptomyces vastus TaxID=285451 RepID=A0ABP6CNS3_9ACTN
MAPRQLSNRLLDNWLRPGAGHLVHVHQVASGEAALVRERRLEICGESGHGLGAPALLLLAGQDELSDLPVHLDQFGVHGSLCAEACARDGFLDLAQEVAVPGGQGLLLGGEAGLRLDVLVHEVRLAHGDRYAGANRFMSSERVRLERVFV